MADENMLHKSSNPVYLRLKEDSDLYLQHGKRQEMEKHVKDVLHFQAHLLQVLPLSHILLYQCLKIPRTMACTQTERQYLHFCEWQTKTCSTRAAIQCTLD